MELSPLVLKGIGLYLGDGLNSTSKNSRNKIAFSNSNEFLLSFTKRFFERINMEIGKVEVLYPSSDSSQQLVDFWSRELNVSRNIIKIRVKENIKSQHCCLTLWIFSNKSRKGLNKVIGIAIKKSSDSRVAKYILQGIIAAEGNVKLTSNNVLNAIRITSVDKKLKRLICNLLKTLSITFNGNSEDVTIYGFKNFQKVKKLKLMNLHPEKKDKFEKGFNELISSTIPGITQHEILKLIKKGRMSRFQLSKKLNKHPDTVYFHLKHLLKSNKIKKVKKGKTHFYSFGPETLPGATAE